MRIAHVVSTFTPRQSSLLQDAIARTQRRGLLPEVITLDGEDAVATQVRPAHEAPRWRLDGLAERWFDVSLGRKWHGAPRARERALERALRAASPTIIHAHHGPNAALAADIALQMDVPLVVSLYPQDLGGMREVAQTRRYVKTMQRADGIVVSSEYQRVNVIGAGAPAERVRVCPAGLDLDAYEVRPRTGPLRRLLCVGSCVARRGFDDVISAAAKMSGDVTLQILGDGPLMPALGRQAREMEVAVQFSPILSARSIAGALEVADVLLCADRTVDAAAGPLPRALLQAHATGLPCVATSHAAIPEAFPGKTWLVPERAPLEMARAVDALCALCDAELEALAAQNRSHIERTFDVERAVDEVMALYEEVV